MGFSVNLENISLKTDHQFLFDNISLKVRAGERVGVVGSSGIGKSSLAWMLMGMLATGIKKSGNISIEGIDIDSSKDWLDSKRGKSIAYIGQYSQSALSPIKKIKHHIQDSFGHKIDSSSIAPLMSKLKIVDSFLERYPHELSGGQLQRINVLLSLMHNPELLILDEVTSSQDNSTALLILDVIKETTIKTNCTIIYISHELDTLDLICQRVIQLDKRTITFDGSIDDFKKSLNFENRTTIKNTNSASPLMSLNNISFFYQKEKVVFEDLNLELRCNEIVGLCGESGSGKSTLAKIICKRLLPKKGDISKSIRVFYVDQEVLTAFNPQHTLSFSVNELANLNGFNKSEVLKYLSDLNLNPDLLENYPLQLSGGQLQRFMFLLAILSKPELLVLDETFSALDPLNLRSALNVLDSLVKVHHWGVVIVSHNIELLGDTCDRQYLLKDKKLTLLNPIV